MQRPPEGAVGKRKEKKRNEPSGKRGRNGENTRIFAKIFAAQKKRGLIVAK